MEVDLFMPLGGGRPGGGDVRFTFGGKDYVCNNPGFCTAIFAQLNLLEFGPDTGAPLTQNIESLISIGREHGFIRLENGGGG